MVNSLSFGRRSGFSFSPTVNPFEDDQRLISKGILEIEGEKKDRKTILETTLSLQPV